MNKPRIAIYPGTFDPVTKGHLDIMRRALNLFDRLIVAVSLNPNKNPHFSQDDRVEFIKQATQDFDNFEVVPFNSLLTDFAKSNNASVIIKGLRAVSDFEFELQMGLMNRTLDENIETLFMIPSQEYSFLSSNLVKEISLHGGETSNLVPEAVALALKKYQIMKFSQRIQRVQPSMTLAITAKAAEMRAQGIDVIGFGAGEPDFDTPWHVRQAGIRAIENNDTHYTPVPGTNALRQAIVDKFKNDNGLHYEKNQIVVSCGAKQSFYNLAQVLWEEGDEIIIPAPYWVSYPDMVLLANAEPVIVATSAGKRF